MKRTGFKLKPRKPLKRTAFKQKAYKPMRRTKLRLVGHSTTAQIKQDIQSILRDIVIARDNGCILRHYKNEITNQYQECGGYRNDGKLILQAEHLHTRSNTASFADTRLVICLCQRHHGYYKPQYSQQYYELVKKHIGKERAELLEKVKNDTTPHKVDLKLALVGLKQELKNYKLEDNKINY